MPLPTVRLSAGIITGLVVGRGTVVLMARILGSLGVPITAATVTSIAYQVTDLTAGTILTSGALTPASVVFNALVQNDPRWTRDNLYNPGPDGNWGFNFLAALTVPAITADNVLTPNIDQQVMHLVQADVGLTMADGSLIVVAYRWRPLESFI